MVRVAKESKRENFNAREIRPRKPYEITLELVSYPDLSRERVWWILSDILALPPHGVM